MDELDPFPELDGAWDARPVPLSRELRMAFIFVRRMRRARWLGAVLSLGFVAANLATWPWKTSSGMFIYHRWLLFTLATAVLTLAILPGFRWNRWALCLGLPFMDCCTHFVHFSTSCVFGNYLPSCNAALYPTLFGGAAAYLLLRRLIVSCVDRRVAWCFLHWYRPCTPPERFNTAPKLQPPPPAHWVTWPLTALSLILVIPPCAQFAVDHARQWRWLYPHF